MRRVIKIGGSLLTRPDLLDVLPRWIDEQNKVAPTENLCVVGGGEIIDAIRQLDRLHPGSAEQTHWWCVDLLQTTARIVGSWFDWPAIQTAAELQAAVRSGFCTTQPTLVHVDAFYSRDSQLDVAAHLPLDWRTTTDAIAAVLADITGADELVLLKSCPIDPALSAAQLARAGIVDEAFPNIATHLNRWRAEQLPQTVSLFPPRK